MLLQYCITIIEHGTKRITKAQAQLKSPILRQDKEDFNWTLRKVSYGFSSTLSTLSNFFYFFIFYEFASEYIFELAFSYVEASPFLREVRELTATLNDPGVEIRMC